MGGEGAEFFTRCRQLEGNHSYAGNSAPEVIETSKACQGTLSNFSR